VTPVRIVLGDTQRAFIEALALRLDDEPDVCVVAAVTRPEDVERVVRSQRLDVAVLSADTGAADFVALGSALLSAQPPPFLVAVSGSDDTAALARAVRMGFRGWVPKEAGVPTLLDVVHAVRRGETWIPPLMLTGLLDRLLLEEEEQRAATAPLASLTVREVDVLRAMTNGASRQETAVQLAMSVNTVRTHTQSILRKLGVHSSLAAVAVARRAGLS
jgi:DNA-binding NarL/FixJ family response regulator